MNRYLIIIGDYNERYKRVFNISREQHSKEDIAESVMIHLQPGEMILNVINIYPYVEKQYIRSLGKPMKLQEFKK